MTGQPLWLARLNGVGVHRKLKTTGSLAVQVCFKQREWACINKVGVMFGPDFVAQMKIGKSHPKPQTQLCHSGHGTVIGQPKCVKRLSRATRT